MTEAAIALSICAIVISVSVFYWSMFSSRVLRELRQELNEAKRSNATLTKAWYAARRECDRMRTALDWIEAEPEDPLKVQLWARAARGDD